MEDHSDAQRVLKTLENHAMRVKHEREGQVAKVRISQSTYEANKAKTSAEADQMRLEIEDLKQDIKFNEADTNEIIVSKNAKAINKKSLR